MLANRAIDVLTSGNQFIRAIQRHPGHHLEAGTARAKCGGSSGGGHHRGFAQLEAEGSKALRIRGGPPQSSVRERIAELGLKHRIATVAMIRQYAEAGALASYGPNLRHNYGEAAFYVDKLLRGTRAADLPAQQPREPARLAH